ncbi:DUF4352 domain-containing protein [Mangrovivirga sp. M17]|uniref:DUF4352 domain-containing protein n=1 Tax=Mangrovivirga halotolerans TaxID=2993936 RepID=A0ABT3RPW1_9BACT|nr:DUF4352 domain-containing protein [Mangrovivirga halotolerans]MCX2743671.1 DUF4352 domain-containing protein [Mangrovivirga halotolerans]
MNTQISTLLLGLLISFSIIISCSDGKENADESKEETEASKPSMAVKNTESYYNNVVKGNMNEPVEMDGKQVTVTEFGEAKPKNTDLFKVAPDKKLVYIKASVKNTGTDPWQSSMVQFFLRDASGKEYAPSLYAIDKGENFPNSELGVGGSATGYIGFEVDALDNDLAVAYAVDLMEGKVIAIGL